MWPFGRQGKQQEEQAEPRERFREGTKALEQGDVDRAIQVLSALVSEQPDYVAARVNQPRCGPRVRPAEHRTEW